MSTLMPIPKTLATRDHKPYTVAMQEDTYCLLNVLVILEPLPPNVHSVEIYEVASDQHSINVKLPDRLRRPEAAVAKIHSQSHLVFLPSDRTVPSVVYVSLSGKFRRSFIS